MERIPYPSNYFDPFGNEPNHAQCERCGEVKDISDMAVVNEVDDIIGTILVGVCHDCEDSDEDEAQDE